jgi:hypothetical protein
VRLGQKILFTEYAATQLSAAEPCCLPTISAAGIAQAACPGRAMHPGTGSAEMGGFRT